MKNTIFFMLLCFLFSCKRENNSLGNSNNWEIYKNVKYFPIPIKDFLEASYGNDFKLANPNEKFNITEKDPMYLPVDKRVSIW